MKKYDDYKSDKNSEDLSKEDLKKVEFTKYVIIVPTIEDKNELIEAFEHIHYSDIDTDYIAVNQLAHEYSDENNIIVDEISYNLLKK